jgi:DNA-binding SARP family transcriptional activator
VTLSISVLGPLELMGPDGPIVIRSSRERAVLVALALWAGEVVSVERLAEVVWGDGAPASSTKVVQNLVLRLRRVLASEVIEMRPSGLCAARRSRCD